MKFEFIKYKSQWVTCIQHTTHCENTEFNFNFYRSTRISIIFIAEDKRKPVEKVLLYIKR